MTLGRVCIEEAKFFVRFMLRGNAEAQNLCLTMGKRPKRNLNNVIRNPINSYGKETT
jgi:hypothetical protein